MGAAFGGGAGMDANLLLNVREETKESVVGRRDIFKIPDNLKTQKKKSNSIVRRDKPTSMLAKLGINENNVNNGIGMDAGFNLMGTQLGGVAGNGLSV